MMVSTALAATSPTHVQAADKGATMIFRPYHYFETGCAAYVFGCGGMGKCAVVDAHEEDVDAYVDVRRGKGMRITHVFDTHVHADHRSGGRGGSPRRSARSTACIESADVAFPFEPLDDGQEIELGNTQVKVLHTPGHTPESICLRRHATCAAARSRGSCSRATRCSSARSAAPTCPATRARTPRELLRQHPRQAAHPAGRPRGLSRRTSRARCAARA